MSAFLRRMASLTAALLLLIGSGFAALASDDTSSSFSGTDKPVSLPQVPDINSAAAIVMDAQSGEILYEKDSLGSYYPASCTKILTAIMVLENGNLSDSVTMSYDAIWGIDRTSCHIALDVGETATVNDLLHGLLIASANECALGLAEYISQKCGGNGTVADFMERANRRAAELGAKNTHFVNPNGLYDENHTTTPYDLAVLLKYAIQNETFVSISRTQRYTVCTDRVPTGHSFSHTNKFINGTYREDDVVCGKSGYTKKSRSSLATYAIRGNASLITVTMGSAVIENSYRDTQALLNHYFDNYAPVSPAASEAVTETATLADGTPFSIRSDVPKTVWLPSGVSFSSLTSRITLDVDTAPLTAGTRVGKITWFYGETQVAEGTVFAAEDVQPTAPVEDASSVGRLIGKILLIAVLVLVSLIVLFLIATAINRTLRRRKRRKLRRNQTIFR